MAWLAWLRAFSRPPRSIQRREERVYPVSAHPLDIAARDAILEGLLVAFPPRPIEASGVTGGLPEVQWLRKELAGVAWPDIEAEFVRNQADVLPLLGPAEYLAVLPAWLRAAVNEPGSDTADAVLAGLEYPPERLDGFTAEQREVVVEAARFILANNGRGLDTVNEEVLEGIERAWTSRKPQSSPG